MCHKIYDSMPESQLRGQPGVVCRVPYHTHLCFSMGLNELDRRLFRFFKLFLGFSLQLTFMGLVGVGCRLLFLSCFDDVKKLFGMDGYGK